MVARGMRILRLLLLAILGWIVFGRFLGVTIYSKYGYAGPTWATQRPLQRQRVQERIAAIGGWRVLRRVSEKFCQDHPERFDWNRGTGSKAELPTVFAAFAPMRVSINAHPEIVYPAHARLVEIQFFGATSTGSHGIPAYYIWVVCGNAPGCVLDA